MTRISYSLIHPVVVPKPSDVLAERLRGLIVDGHFAPGDPLPTERELVVDAKLSRASVRDALRVLETEGLISTRVGRAGGSIVTLPGRNSVVRSVALFVRTHHIRLQSLSECRIAVEPTLARLAAARRTDNQLNEIAEIHRQFVASIEDVALRTSINRDWHLAIALASGNEPLIALIEPILNLIREAQSNRYAAASDLRGVVKDHAAVTEAIADKDGDAAFNYMEQDVSAFLDAATKAEVIGGLSNS